MRTRAGLLLAFALVAVLNTPRAGGPALAAAGGQFQGGADDQADRSGDKAIVHLLNRMGYGPRPGDLERVRAMGIQKYIDLQLHPDRIDDRVMDGWLARLTTVSLSSREISEQFEQPQIEARRLRQLQAGQNPQGPPQNQPPTGQDPWAPQRQGLPPQGPPPQGFPPDPNMMTPEQRAARGVPPMPPAQNPLFELQEQKLLRAIYSERQLQEVLADFWFNHFNVDATKGRTRFMLTEYERESIRPHVLGKFRDLLGATAKSPAMLFYLDNFQSVDPNATMNRGRSSTPQVQARNGRLQLLMPQPPPPPPPNARGLNENYARELMELHTLGVDGGYTQKDVTEVARAFTGWGIDNPRLGGGFLFNERMHDNRDKTVLGHKVQSRGIRDGEEVLDILASHPSTARFISTKLARRFVSDTPPPALVARLETRFTETRGDLREVMRTLLTSPEFQSPSAYRAKVKTPLDFVVSAIRATGANIVTARPLVNALQQLGMPLYQCQPPTGYKDTAETWTNTGALVTRMNFAANLAGNRQLGMSPRELQALGASDVMIDSVLNGDASETTRSTVARAQTPPQMLALTLGSPEFQRR